MSHNHAYLRSFLCMMCFLLISAYPFPGAAQSKPPPPLVVCVLRHFPPQYLTGDDGKPAGFAVDVIERILEANRLPFKYLVVEDWEEAFSALKSGNADIIPNMGITDRRKLWFAFTPPVETFPVSLFVRKSTYDIHGIKDLYGRKTLAVALNVGVKLVSEHPQTELVVSENVYNALFDLLSGKADALVYPEPVLLNLAADAGVAHHIKTAGSPLLEIKRAISVHKENTALLAMLTDSVSRFLKSEDYSRIYRKWYKKGHPFWNTKLILIFSAVSLVLVLVLMGLWRYYSVMRLNRKLTENIEAREKVEKELIGIQENLEAMVAERTRSLEEKNQELEEEVAARTHAEETLRFQGILLDSTSESVIATDMNANIIFWSKGSEKLYGYTREEAMGCPVSMIVPGDGKQDEKNRIDHVRVHGTWSGEYMQIRKDGTGFLSETTISLVRDADGNPLGMVGIDRDITERKENEARLRESEERFRVVFDQAPVGIAMVDLGFHLMRANQAYCQMLGYTEKELSALTISDITHPEDVEENMRLQKMLGQGLIPEYEMEKRFIRKDGSIAQGLLIASLLTNEEDEAVCFIGQVLDITSKKEQEQQLFESEMRYRMLFSRGNDAIFIYHLENGRPSAFKEVNAVAGHLLGYTEEEFLEMGPEDIYVLPEEEGREVSSSGKPTNGHLLFERILKGKDDIRVPVEIHSHVIDLADTKTVMDIARDITERKEMEKEKQKIAERLQQAQKMEALGTLAGGIAHDFNNILFPIIGYTEICMFMVEKSGQLKENLQEIFLAAKRAQELVKQILTFSRQRDFETIPFDMHLIVKEAMKLLQSTFPATIEIKTKIDTDCPKIMGDPTQVHQVVMNLCTNAFHAMEATGGTLLVEMKKVDLDEEDVEKRPDLKPGSYIRLSVSDTGEGIPHNIIKMIFDPYFTTKPQNKGTGLGLSMVHGIVKSMEGDISVYSDPGRGTVFHVFFPIRKTPETDTRENLKEEIAGGTEHILLVDDEKQIVEMVTRMLRQLGYKVTHCTSSIKALQVFENNPEGFDLVLTDLTMPQMTGLELSRNIWDIRKEIPIVMATGFSERITAETAKDMGIRELIMKPTLKRELALAIRNALDG